ncbi:hypothetical protein D3C80_2192670 [compost metagenome]
MPLDQGAERLAQGLDVQLAVEQEGTGKVVGSGKRRHALQEPQALLREGKELRTVMGPR